MITTATEARGAKLRRYKLPITVICVHTVHSVQYSTVQYSTVQYSTLCSFKPRDEKIQLRSDSVIFILTAAAKLQEITYYVN